MKYRDLRKYLNPRYQQFDIVPWWLRPSVTRVSGVLTLPPAGTFGGYDVPIGDDIAKTPTQRALISKGDLCRVAFLVLKILWL
jgi:hypothetical protein